MKSYVIFLRAVNVSGKHILPMALLKNELSHLGFDAVRTYIQSGNILLKSKLDKQDIKYAIEDLIHKKFSFTIEAFVLNEEELIRAINNNPFDSSLPGNRVFYTFISQPPSEENLVKSKLIPIGSEEFYLIDHVVYFYLPEGMARSVLNNAFFEKKWNTVATGRNLNTILKMKELIQINN
ncbi:DUF1697 domain-containing protein [Sphingobacterium sp. HJSM2_6]|uniref:DUF1697 domain-containing protein n=1 Tax=Sphingobacterium sp. HJSM2_6 TaxID=3366264 RepID=UPI003BBB73B1